MTRVAAAMLLAVILHSPADAAKIKREDWVADYSAVAMGTGHVGAASGRAGRIDIEVYRWTTAEERQAILELLATGDGKKIRAGLDDLEDIGRVRMPGQSGYELIYAWQPEENGKKMVVVAMNRPIASLPGATSGNSVDYLVGVAILDPADGTGVIAPAVELEIKPDGQIDVAESAADALKLTNVKSGK
ncbi:MAG TPA: hypothetical protein VHR17_07820 [Thermoanaerobaculia bacterium]|nr:hypothetical protein [Thermoanaerobaculia bacterium]